MRKLTVGLLSAAALATTVLLVRQQKQPETAAFGFSSRCIRCRGGCKR